MCGTSGKYVDITNKTPSKCVHQHRKISFFLQMMVGRSAGADVLRPPEVRKC